MFTASRLNERILPLTFVALVICLVATRPAQAQVDKWGAWENGVTESWWLSSKTFTDEDVANAIARWKSIGEIKSLDWEGDYFSGSEVHGTYVRWSPGGGFIIADVDKCQALVMSLTYGRVNATPGLIEFIPEFSKSSKSHGHHSRKGADAVLSFVPIKWQSSLYLIHKDKIDEFTDYVAGLGKFNALNAMDAFLPDWPFYSKPTGKLVTDDGPVLPVEYQRFVKTPITGKITAVLGRKIQRKYSYEFTSEAFSFATEHDLASLTTVTVNIGSIHGARKGLFLRVVNPNLGEALRLIEVGRTSSRGVLVRQVENRKEKYYDNDAESEREYPPVAVGWTLTTALRQ